MFKLKERSGATSIAAARSLLRRRRQLYPFFIRMGPVALCMTSVLLIGLMAILYLSQVGQAVAANQQLQDIRSQQVALERQNQDLVATIAKEQSPVYVADYAKRAGLIPADPKDVQIVIVDGLQPIGGLEDLLRP